MSAEPTFRGRKLSGPDLEFIRAKIEKSDSTEVLSDDMRDLIANQWPHLMSKLARQKPR